MREMKDSGFGYLGEIPDHWRIERIKNHLRFSPDKNPGDAMVLSLYREHGIVPKDSRDDNHNVTSEDTSNYRYVQVGDFVVNKMKAWQGSMGVSGYEGVVSPAYYVYRFTTDDFDKKYLHYLLRSKCFADEFRRLSGGIRIGQWDLPKVGFETTYVSVPPKGEQIVIAEYIDAQLNKVDTLVVNVQAQIEKLKSYKQSLITEVVTKGLDPTVPMKDSGVEWIGNIPTTWYSIRLKYLLSVKSGDAIRNELLSDEGLVPVYGGGEMIGYTSEANVPDGSILIGRVGARCGCITLPDGIAWATDNALVVSTNVNRKYLYYLLVACNLNRLNTSNAQPLITGGKIREAAVPFTIVDSEQAEIVHYLDHRTFVIDKLIATKEEKINKLQQYKYSVIYEYVTGKKNVAVP